MAERKNLRARSPRAFQMLRQAALAAEEWPLAGPAVRRFQDAEDWAIAELKIRLDAMEQRLPPDPPQPGLSAEPPSAMLARLLRESRSVDPEAARLDLYRQTLSRLLPDQVAMLALLAERGIAPLCHVAASRLPAGPVRMVVLANASSLGRDAGVLLREHVPQYVTEMLMLGVFETGAEDDRLAEGYELLLADTQVRNTMDRIRGELKLYPRLQRYSLRLSAYGQALWRDCHSPAHDRGRGQAAETP